MMKVGQDCTEGSLLSPRQLGPDHTVLGQAWSGWKTEVLTKQTGVSSGIVPTDNISVYDCSLRHCGSTLYGLPSFNVMIHTYLR